MMKKTRKGRKKEGVKKMKKKKKEKVSKEGSEHEPARSTQVKRPHVCMPWAYTSAEKHSAAWLHPTLPSRALAKPRHSPHSLLALLSTALASRAQTLEECSSSGLGLCYSTPFGNCSHTQKEMHFVPLTIVAMELTTKAQGSCTLAVCV